MSAIAITITNASSELVRVSEAADRFAAANQLSPDVAADLHVALDEVLTNIIKYGYTDSRAHEISVQLRVEDGVLVAEVEDDGRPFDPLTLPELEGETPLRKRRVGGVGVHFLRKLMSEVSYRRTADRNRLVFKIRLKT